MIGNTVPALTYDRKYAATLTEDIQCQKTGSMMPKTESGATLLGWKLESTDLLSGQRVTPGCWPVMQSCFFPSYWHQNSEAMNMRICPNESAVSIVS